MERQRVRFGFGQFSDRNAKELAENIRLAEDCGFEYAWVSDQFNNRNVFVTLTYAATLTKRIRLGTAVVNPYFRHPTILASAAASLNEVSDGRAVLGIGSGAIEGPESSPAYSKEDRFGRIGKPMPATREAVEITHRLLRGESLTYHGEVFRTNECKLTFPPMKIPIYVGARRKLMLRLGGELADGVVTHGVDGGYIEYMASQIKLGAQKRGRSLDGFDLATWIYLTTSTDSERVRALFKTMTAWLAESMPEEAIPHMDVSEGTLESVRKIRELVAAGRTEAAAEHVDDKLVDSMFIIGKKERCLRTIEKAIEHGATQIILSALPEETEDVIRFVGKEIIPHFNPH